MMEHEKFTSLNSLYERLVPALRTRMHELHQKKLYFIKEEDIFQAIRINRWNDTRGLTLFDMVDDILNIEEEIILEYIRLKVEQHE